MKTEKRKALSVGLLLIVGLVFIVTGCSNENQRAPISGQEGNGNGDERDHLTLTWRVAGSNVEPNAIFPDAGSDFIKQTIEEKFNVTLDLTSDLYSSEYDTKMTMQLSADPPDLFMAGGVQSQGYALDGLLADMTPFISPETMPNYFKYWLSDEELNRYQIQDAFVRAPIPFARNVYRSYYIRKDWLDQLGLDVPDSYEDTLEVMRAFTFDDPDGNQRNDTFGFTASGNGRSYSWDFPGFVENDVYVFDLDLDAGTFRYGLTDLALVDVLEDIQQLEREKIIDPDWFLNSGTDHWNKAIEGRAGIIVGSSKDFMLDGNPNSIHNRSRQLNPEADWVPFNPHPDKPIWLTNLPSNPFLFHVQIAEQRPEHIVRTIEILDWMAGEEGYLLTHFGQEGIHYTRNGNEIEIIPEAYNEITSWLSLYSFFTPKDEEDKLGLEFVDPRFTDRDRKIIETIRSYKLKDHIGTNVAPPPNVDLGGFDTRIAEFVVQVLFEEPDASNWPQYQEELNTLYSGREILEAYAEQISRAHGREIRYIPGPGE